MGSECYSISNMLCISTQTYNIHYACLLLFSVQGACHVQGHVRDILGNVVKF